MKNMILSALFASVALAPVVSYAAPKEQLRSMHVSTIPQKGVDMGVYIDGIGHVTFSVVVKNDNAITMQFHFPEGLLSQEQLQKLAQDMVAAMQKEGGSQLKSSYSINKGTLIIECTAKGIGKQFRKELK